MEQAIAEKLRELEGKLRDNASRADGDYDGDMSGCFAYEKALEDVADAFRELAALFAKSTQT